MSDLISRADVLKYPIRLDHYDEVNGDRVFVYGVESVIEYVESLPSAEAVHIHNDGTLEVKVPNAQKVGRVLVMDTDSHIGGGLFYPAEAVSGYTEWLEKIIIDNEGANEWLCEDTPDLEWCEKNCHYSSIQAECLRHLYEVSKGGDDE